jgi:type I restriction enzyme S subunit
LSELQSFIASRTPEGWATKPLWSLFRRRKRTGYAEEELLSVYRDYGVIPKSSRDDNHNKESEDLSAYQLVTEGALVTNKMKAWQGSIAISRFRGIVSPAYYVYEPLSKECDQFLHYLLRSEPYIALYGRISKGVRVNQWDLEHEALRNVAVMLPNIATQKAIAGFLDRETARIDQLIERKQRFAALAETEFQSFLTRAVTIGLHRTAKMKTSSATWVSSTPAHWTITRLKFLCSRIVDCLHETPEHKDDGEFPSIRTADVSRGSVSVATAKRVSASEYVHRIQRLEPKKDDVLYTREGERFGLAALVPPDTQLCLGQRMMMFRTNSSVLPGYLMWSLNGDLAYNYIKQSTAGATSPHLNIFDIRNVPIFLPPRQEQQHIIDAISARFFKKQQLISLVIESIGKLQEYRSTLIAAAVTGQVDLSAWVKHENIGHLEQIKKAVSA